MIREWGFDCSCPLCSASPSQIAASDRRRQRIQYIIALLSSDKNRNYKTVNDLVVEILDLCEKEGLAAQVGDIHRVIANFYARMGDIESAKRHGTLAAQKLSHYSGFDGDRTVSAIQFLESITKAGIPRRRGRSS